MTIKFPRKGKHVISACLAVLSAVGIDLRATFAFLVGMPSYLRSYWVLRRQKLQYPSDSFEYGRLYPCFSDRFSESGSAKGHYFHQDLLVAAKIFSTNPTKHIDVGSRVDGFVAHVACFRPVQVIDIRPLESKVKNISYLQADMMGDVPESLVESTDSLSCLHALEHFGLGRYGDPIRWDGHVVGLSNLHRILKRNGTLHLSVPIGKQRIEFNAHRVFSLSYLLGLFDGLFKLREFSYVDDAGDLHENVALEEGLIQSSMRCHYGCGIFRLVKF